MASTRSRFSGGWKRPDKFIHGQRNSPEYAVWRTMKARCTNPKRPEFSHYGERGISVCERWMTSFAAFLADMGHRPSLHHQLDRIDNSRGYEPENCRWATARENSTNRRSSVFVEYGGHKRTLNEWARTAGVTVQPTTLSMRLKAGWDIEKALFTGPWKGPWRGIGA